MDLGATAWSLIVGIAVAAFTAQAALMRYLDQRRRELFQARYLDGSLDPLVDALVASFARESRNLALARDLVLQLARPVDLSSEQIDRYRDLLRPPEPILSGKHLRIVGVLPSDPFLPALLRCTSFLEHNFLSYGPGILTIIEEHSRQPVADRKTAASGLQRVLAAQLEELTTAADTVPEILCNIANELAEAVYAEGDFDFGSIRRAMSLEGYVRRLATIGDRLGEASKKTMAAITEYAQSAASTSTSPARQHD